MSLGVCPITLKEANAFVEQHHRHHGGFRLHTGVDAYGVSHTITVDERYSVFRNFCPNCGAWNGGKKE